MEAQLPCHLPFSCPFDSPSVHAYIAPNPKPKLEVPTAGDAAVDDARPVCATTRAGYRIWKSC